MTHFVGILSQQPSVGKTTTAVYLAALLARAGQRALLVDGGRDYDASQRLGIASPVAAPLDGSRAEAVPGAEALGVLSFGSVERGDLRPTFVSWDYVIFDLPEGIDGQDEQVMALLDRAILVVTSGSSTVSEVAAILTGITDLKARSNPALSLEGVLITFAEKDLKRFESSLTQLDRLLPVDVFPFAIPQDERLETASLVPSAGLDVALSSRGVRGYVELAMEVLTHDAT